MKPKGVTFQGLASRENYRIRNKSSCQEKGWYVSDMSKKHTTVLDFLAAFFFIGVTAVCLFISASFISSYNRAKDSVNWLHVEGKVSENANPTHLGGARDPETVWYEYMVDGKRFDACRVRFFEPDGLSNAQSGAIVQVFYDPKHPREACLVPGVSDTTTIRILVFFGVLGAGTFAILHLVYSALFSSKSSWRLAQDARKRARIAFKNREFLHYS